MHGGAKLAFYVTGALWCLLIVTLPIGVWMIMAASRARVEMTDDTLVVRNFWTIRIPYAEMHRLGTLRVRVVGHGILAYLVRKKVGGPIAVNFCAMNLQGRTRKFLASMFENHEDFIARASQIAHRPVENVSFGLVGVKWD
jgi:hypothetical protein